MQYASQQFRTLLEAHGMVQSMSRKGDCYDNAAMEIALSEAEVQWRVPRQPLIDRGLRSVKLAASKEHPG